MYFICCVRNCESTRQDVKLHKFPKDEKRLNKWLECLRDDDTLQRSPVKNLFVCSKHFEKRFIGASGSKLLSGAYPTLFTLDEISCGNPSEQKGAAATVVDHAYFKQRHFDHTYAKDVTASTLATKHVPKEDSPQLGSSNLLECPTQDHEMDTEELQVQAEDHEMDTEELRRTAEQAETITNPVLLEEPSLSILRIEVRSETPITAATISATIDRGITTTIPTVKQSSRRRNLSKLTPTCKKNYKEFYKAKKQADIHRHAKQAIKFAEEKKNLFKACFEEFEEMETKMYPYARKFFEIQIKLCT